MAENKSTYSKGAKKAGKASPKAKKKSPSKEKQGGSEFAVIESGGKQYSVSVGDVVKIEKLSGDHKEGGKIIFDKVLLVDNGKDTTIGTPYIDKARVEGVLEKEGRDKKINVIRFKSKSRYFKQKGHRQPFMKVRINEIR